MKRSEVIKFIWEYVQNVEDDYDIYMTEHNCETLLGMLETIGMLPPSYLKRLTEDEAEQYGVDDTSYYTHDRLVNEWEKE